MTAPLRAPRYLTEFRCLAQDCPDTCCAGFTVRLSAEDVARVKTAATVVELKTALEDDPRDDGAVASLRQGHGCTFLQADRLCSLIARKGEPAIPDACALYPRTLSYFPDRTEVHATAACPEIARRLLADDSALEVVDTGPQIAARIDPAPGRGARTPYTARREEVLALADEVLQRPAPLRDRLSLLARFAARVTPFFHHGADADDPKAFAAAVNWARSAKALGAPSEAREGDRAVAAQIVFGMLMNLREAPMPRFAAVLDAAFGNYQRALRPGAQDAMFDALAEAAADKAAVADRAYGPALEPMLTRHLRNEWRRVWFTGTPTLPGYLFKQLVELLAIRLLLIAHPAIEQGAASGQPLLEQAVIDVVQIVTRRLGSSQGLLEALETNLTPTALGTDEAGRLELLLHLGWPG